MKKCYPVFRVFTFLIFSMPFVVNAQVWTEDFDGSNATNPPIFSHQCSDDRDYIDIVCQDGAGCANEINSAFTLNGATGQYFGVRDMDHSPCASATLSETLSFSGIDISSCTGVLHICFDVAESRNMGGAAGDEWSSSNNREDTWDGSSNATIRARVDGAPFTTVTAIEDFDGSDTRPGIDVNCDGKSDDAGEPELTDTFTKYCFELPTDGNSLDLEFEVNELNTGGEDLAIDNIEVHCDIPGSGTILAACTPFVSSGGGGGTGTSIFLEDFDGSNTTNPPAFSLQCSDDRDYIDIVCQNGAGCANEINSDFTLNAASGQYLGVRDMDHSPCTSGLNETVSFSGIDISSCSGEILYVCFDAAESRNQGGAGGTEWGNSN